VKLRVLNHSYQSDDKEFLFRRTIVEKWNPHYKLFENMRRVRDIFETESWIVYVDRENGQIKMLT
jgi:hypothetical protein